MQDWDKLAWKQGDVLVDSEGTYVMFDGWSEDNFSEFNTKYSATPLGYGKFSIDEDRIFSTLDFNKVDFYTRKHFINLLEKEYNGKFNPETMEIDKQQKFNEGDIVYIQSGYGLFDVVFIYKDKDEDRIYGYATYIYGRGLFFDESTVAFAAYMKDARLATEEEKETLFNALKEVGKWWNSYTKQIEDLPKGCNLKPFQKVLVRDLPDKEWCANIFSHHGSNESYVCIDTFYKYCIPYEGNEHLLGTADSPEKGGVSNEHR